VVFFSSAQIRPISKRVVTFISFQPMCYQLSNFVWKLKAGEECQKPVARHIKSVAEYKFKELPGLAWMVCSVFVLNVEPNEK